MSSVLVGLVGDDEPASSTIRRLLAQAWADSGHADAVVFASPLGTGTDGTDPLTPDDLADMARVGPVYVYVSDGDRVPDDESNDTVLVTRHVVVRAGRSAAADPASAAVLNDVLNTIDDAVLRRRTGPYPKAADSLDSSITAITGRAVSWERRQDADEESVTVAYEGTIACSVQRSATRDDAADAAAAAAYVQMSAAPKTVRRGGATDVTYTVHSSRAAPAGGITVTLQWVSHNNVMQESSLNGIRAAHPSITIPEGDSSASIVVRVETRSRNGSLAVVYTPPPGYAARHDTLTLAAV